MHIRFTSPRFKLEFPDPHKKMSDLLDTAGQVLKEEPHHMHIITLVVNDNGQKVGEDIRFRFTPDCEEHLNLSLMDFISTGGKLTSNETLEAIVFHGHHDHS